MTVKISGTTGVSHVNNGAVTQADLAENIAGNGPLLIASSSSVGGLVNNSTVVLALNEIYDTANAFASNQFKPLVPGFYSVTFKSTVAGSGITRYFASIYKNGSDYVRGQDCPVLSGAEAHSVGSCLVYLNGTTDYIDLRAYFSGASGVHSSQLTATLIRSAYGGGAGPDVIGVGSGQTWQDVTASRALSTSYQNTTGRPIQVSVCVYGTSDAVADAYHLQVSTNNSSWVVASAQNVSFSNSAVYQAYSLTSTVIVPTNSYYRVVASSGTVNISIWSELR